MKREKGAYYRRLGWVMIVPCTSKKALRTDSQKGIGAMLGTKLATIVEEEHEGLYDRVDELRYNNNNNDPSTTKIISSNKLLWFNKEKKKGNELIRSRFKKSRLLVSHNLCIKGSYINFLAGFVAKGTLTGLPRY